jgi:hypothetical protein
MKTKIVLAVVMQVMPADFEQMLSAVWGRHSEFLLKQVFAVRAPTGNASDIFLTFQTVLGKLVRPVLII